MAIRIRRVGRTLVALCAAATSPAAGDVYLDDEQHHALRCKFDRDFHEEGLLEAMPNKEWEIMERIERKGGGE